MVVLHAVRYGHVTIDGRDYPHDVIVFPDGTVVPRAYSDVVAYPEARRLLSARPEVVVVGRGFASRLHIDEAARAVFVQNGIELIEGRTQDMLRIINTMRHRQRLAAVVRVTD